MTLLGRCARAPSWHGARAAGRRHARDPSGLGPAVEGKTSRLEDGYTAGEPGGTWAGTHAAGAICALGAAWSRHYARRNTGRSRKGRADRAKLMHGTIEDSTPIALI